MPLWEESESSELWRKNKITITIIIILIIYPIFTILMIDYV